MALIRNESGKRKLGSAQETVLRMCRPEYPVRNPVGRTLRILYALEDRGLVYRNFGVWRLSLQGEETQAELERGDAA